MNLKSRLLSFAAAGTIVSASLLASGVVAADAATNLGNLTITPATGTTQSTMTGSTTAQCPPGSTGINGYLVGSGITPGNDILQSNTDINNAQGPGGLNFPFTSTFFDVFQSNAVNAPSGTYTVRIACIGSDFFSEVGEFTQQVTFTHAAGQANFVSNYATAVPAQNTTTTVAQNTASGNFGDSVTFTATVAPSGATGTVQFKDGAANLGSAVNVASGTASFTTSSLAVGSHSISAVYTPNTTAYNGSTSNTVTHAVNAVATSMSLSSNGPTVIDAPATFTSTVSPAADGVVSFTVDGGAPINRSVTAGSPTATYSTSALAVGAHTVAAHFEPAAGSGATATDATPITHNVTDVPPGVVNETITVTVPTGGLTIVLDDGADGDVDLGTAQMNAAGDLFTASGEMDVVKVTDTRAGDIHWTASGIVTDVSNGTDSVNGYNLGWAPHIVASAAHQAGIAAGANVAAGTETVPTATPANPAVGLESSRPLASTQDGAAIGTARLGALLSLNIPTDVSAGTYTALLTLTVA